jgi:D-3-phosphoglycerate dehydrogenase / 2-oxoglutarate reductase
MGYFLLMTRILVTPHLLNNMPGVYRDTLEAAGFEVVYPPKGFNTLDPKNITQLLKDGYEGMLASTEPLSREILQQSKLRAIARLGVGYDSIDVRAATDLNIVLTITPGTVEVSVAEQAFAMLLGITRAVISRDQEVRTGNWMRAPLPRLDGKTFGIIGFGRIGRVMVPRIQAFGMKVIAYDVAPDRSFADAHQVRLVELEELLGEADVVSIHAPLTPATNNLINRKTLALMKPTALLINLSRGTLVNEDDLVEALKAKTIAGAALDVFQQEPLPVDSPLLSLDNVLLSSHVGGIDAESQEATSRLAARCLADLFQGKWPGDCVVNKQLAGRWKW